MSANEKDLPHSAAGHNPLWCQGSCDGQACGDDPCWSCIDWAFAELSKLEAELEQTSAECIHAVTTANKYADENTKLRSAMTQLLDKLGAVAKATEGMFALAHIHGMGYQGPNWNEEYAAARALLAASREKEAELQTELAKLRAENVKLRELLRQVEEYDLAILPVALRIEICALFADQKDKANGKF